MLLLRKHLRAHRQEIIDIVIGKNEANTGKTLSGCS